MPKKTPLLLLFICIRLFLYSQKVNTLNSYNQPKDYETEIKTLLKSANKYRNSNEYKKSLSFSKKGVLLSKKNNDINNELTFLNLSAENYFYLSDFIKSIKIYKILYKTATNENNEKYKGFAFNGFLKNYWRLGEYKKAVAYADSAIEIFEKINDNENKNITLLNLANIYIDIKDYNSAKKIFDILLEKAEKESDTLLIADILEKKGVVSFFEQMYPTARKYYGEAYLLYKSINNELSAAIETGNIGETYEMEGKYKNAVQLYKKAIQTESKFNYYSGLIFLYEAVGRSYIKMHNYKEAEKYLFQAYSYIKLTGEKRELPNIYKMLYTVYQKKGDYKKAFEYALKEMEAKDSLLNENVKNQINKIRINYETEKAEKENKILKMTQEKQTRQNKIQKLIITVISIFLVFILLFLLLLYKFNKKNRRIKLMLAAKNKELNEAYGDIKKSIEYAGKIQFAMMSSCNNVLKDFSEYVIFYKPSHTLSGDFYWAKKIKDTLFVAVGDSTGHGIPGALLSITGMSFLDETVTEDFIQTDVILNNMRNKIKHRLNQHGKFHEHKDGWDMSVFSINIKNLSANFSGAYNSLYVIKNPGKTGKIIQYKADRQPVAIYCKEKPFEKHGFRLNKGDIVWMFTDGYTDQFNPETMKKFTLKRLKELLLKISDLPLKEQKNILKSEFMKWKGNYEQIDDILLLGIRI